MPAIHANARTTPAVRTEIARSREPTGVLAQRYGVSTETIRKWRKRGPADCQDHSSRPHKLPWKASLLHGSGGWHLGMAGVGGRPLRGPWIPDAVQGQCCSPASYPETAAPDHELDRIRCCLAPAREPDGLVYRGGDRGLAG